MHAVIGIDVSKATSQVAVAVDGKVVQNFKITHDVFGFNQLNSVIIALILKKWTIFIQLLRQHLRYDFYYKN